MRPCFALLLILAAAACGTQVSTTSQSQPPQTDYFVRDAVVEVMSDAGEPLYRMHADEIQHFPNKSMRANTVHIDYLGGADGVWQLDAVHAYMPPEQDTVQLTDGVRIHNESPEGQTLMQTAAASVNMTTERIMSREPVSIQGPDHRSTSVGMEAGFKSRDLTLLQNVQSTIYPQAYAQ
jgi:LPS export ABC transporter protein LptC